MKFDTQLFFTALGLAFVLEGLPWILFPDHMRKVMQTAVISPATLLRRMGLLALALGLLTIWLARAYGNA